MPKVNLYMWSRHLEKVLSTFPLAVILLPVFFVAHGYIEHFNFVPIDEALLLTLFYIGVSLVILILFRIAFRSLARASIFTFCLLCFQFFFGGILDQLKAWPLTGSLAKYTVIIPLALVGFTLLFILLKRRKKDLSKAVLYINLLLLLSITVDIVLFLPRYFSMRKINLDALSHDNFTTCDSCSRPDIYLIVADEYAGARELKELMNFDNRPFLDSLRRRGFQVMDNSYSNYISTVSSMASFFNMDYLPRQPEEHDHDPESGGFNLFRNNPALRFLKTQGYSIVNNSIFDVDGKKTIALDFLPRQTALITFHTFTNRLWHDAGFNFATRFKITYLAHRYLYSTQRRNEMIMENIRREAARQTTIPRFIYTHSMMPHYPFYFRKDGTRFPPESIREELQVVRANYVEYLQYANGRYLSMIDYILKNSSRPPVILFLSDHGYRHFTDTARVDDMYKFMNLMTIYLPEKNRKALPDTLSNVNYLRAFFNHQFSQSFPMLKDSIFIPGK